jgi:hypothetical protein
MIDPTLIGLGVAEGIAGNLLTDKLVSPPPENDPQFRMMQMMVKHLEEINRSVSRNSHEDLIFQLGTSSTSEVVVPDKGRDHLSILIPSQNTSGTLISVAQLIFAIPGVGQLTTNLTPGWTQIDLPPYTRIWTNDSNSYNVILSFRDNPLGSFL